MHTLDGHMILLRRTGSHVGCTHGFPILLFHPSNLFGIAENSLNDEKQVKKIGKSRRLHNMWQRKMIHGIQKHVKGTVTVCGLLTLLGIGAVIGLMWHARTAQAAGIQEGIASEIIRFHVLANSDREEDQTLKLEVKTQVVYYMKELLHSTETIEDTRQVIQNSLGEIQGKAEEVIREQGYDYGVTAELEKCYFPIKTYGDCTFPAGEYEALRIRIGEAKGKNWWCVLFPNLCFLDSIHAVVPEREKQELKNVLTEEEYESLFSWKDSKVKVTTKWF